MAAAPDADLHARLAHFQDAHQKATAAHQAWIAERDRLEARTPNHTKTATPPPRMMHCKIDSGIADRGMIGC